MFNGLLLSNNQYYTISNVSASSDDITDRNLRIVGNKFINGLLNGKIKSTALVSLLYLKVPHRVS